MNKNIPILVNKNTVTIGKNVIFGKNVYIYPNVTIDNNIMIGNNVVIQPCCTILNNVVIEQNCFIGSNTLIRDKVLIKENTRIGPHCEIVRSEIGSKCLIGHKNFIGDAIIEENVKFGCGAVVANSDFKNHFQTIIHKNCCIGANATLISPLVIKQNSFVAAGSVITENVENDTLAIARSKQLSKKIKKY